MVTRNANTYMYENFTCGLGEMDEEKLRQLPPAQAENIRSQVVLKFTERDFGPQNPLNKVHVFALGAEAADKLVEAIQARRGKKSVVLPTAEELRSVNNG